MMGLMQDWPLRVSRIIDHAAKYHPDRRIVSASAEGPIVETTWRQLREGALRSAQRLSRMGLAKGDRVGLMAWNTARHLELWYGVPGAGGVAHTLNPRLSAEQLVYIVNHAADRFLAFDPDLAPVVAAIAPRLETVERFICLADAAHAPPTPFDCAPWDAAPADGDFAWVGGEEGEACGLCYTSGTTGAPKGVCYSHRSNVLHAMAMVQPDMLALSARDVLMPVVPLFHANGWSTAYSAPMVGAGMVLPGRDLTPPALHSMLERGVTVTAAVPTVWLGLLDHMRREGLRLSTLNRVVIGGSACPQSVIEAFQRDYGVEVLHAWGMTETSPLGSFASLKPEILALPEAERMAAKLSVGHPPFTVDLDLRDDFGAPVLRDGASRGRLVVRGPCVAKRYVGAEADATDPEGWFDTGDVATMDGLGYVRIVDRSKDVIKSGGEWISSIDLENVAVGCPGVLEAAAVGVAHPKWGERPVLVIRPDPAAPPDAARVLDHMRPHFATWQLPDDVLFMAALPHTATGKLSKRDLRAQLEQMGYSLPHA
ncbi:long-chain-fatty-acid--CoA ligase [Rubrimonas cliftonensis]|uniref:Fatty-acyl-CoA synthase n=1 Tax=Rubrimonas cliftonensis TaxID=89524 RepID=A0A1H3VE50_9RHOB|nr:long-chain-fatty-acid--CoA ligase [Rubrimonas cliftonensis]SDZ73010.1 fatty-acyl-CoA synthase [Rubrimonas cliftonensis]